VTPTVQLPGTPRLDQATVSQRKAKAMRAISELPPFSPILGRLMASLQGEDVSFAELGDLMEKDTVVSGNVLQLVNSAAYARRTSITSVRHALALLGTMKIRNVVLGMQVAGMWNRTKVPPGFSIARLNMHSAAVGILTDLIAAAVPADFAEGAFIGGLLHDVGRLLIAIGLPAEFAMLARKQAETGADMVECERAFLGFTHAELSERALAEWKLPQIIQTAVGRHHHALSSSRGPAPLGPIIAAADRYANSLGISVIAKEPPGKTEPQIDTMEALGLTGETLERVLKGFQTEFEASAPFFR
jgi:HD-like signal output (HDOD) protein